MGSHDGRQRSAGTGLKALIVGGDQSYVYGNIDRNLRTLGIYVGGHCGYRPPSGLGGCALVIILCDTADETLIHGARSLAERWGVPWVSTSRKWSVMQADVTNVLDRCGIVRPIEQDDSAPPDPDSDEIQDSLSAADSLAQETAHLRDALSVVYEEHPEMVLDDAAALQAAQDLAPEVSLSHAVCMEIVQQTVKRQRAAWKVIAEQSVGPGHPLFGEKQRFGELRRRVLMRYVREVIDREGHKPTGTRLQTRCLKVFGFSPDVSVLYSDIRRSQKAMEPTPPVQASIEPVVSPATPVPTVEPTPPPDAVPVLPPEPVAKPAPAPEVVTSTRLRMRIMRSVEREKFETMTAAWLALLAAGVAPLSVPELSDFFGGRPPAGRPEVLMAEITARPELRITPVDLPDGWETIVVTIEDPHDLWSPGDV